MFLQKYSADDEDGAGDGRGEDGFTEYKVDHNEREEGNQVDQARDVSGRSGEFQRLEPNQKGDTHLEQAHVDYPKGAF